MSIDRQLDIFHEPVDPDPDRWVTCHHCGYSWTRGGFTAEHWMKVHTQLDGGPYAGFPGRCLNQQLLLERLYLRVVDPNRQWEFDLIGLLAQATALGVDNAHVLEVLGRAQPHAEVSA